MISDILSWWRTYRRWIRDLDFLMAVLRHKGRHEMREAMRRGIPLRVFRMPAAEFEDYLDEVRGARR